MRSYKSAIVILIAVISVLAGCTTSSGSLFSDVVGTDSGSNAGDTTDSSEEYEEIPGVTVRTSPWYADIYIDDVYMGQSPLREMMSAGTYRITVEKEGYYTYTDWFSFDGDEALTLDIDLEPITGFLDVTTYPKGALLKANGEKLKPGLNELKIGRYVVRAELFGYEPAEKPVVIHEQKTTPVSFNLEPAEFRLSSPFLSRKAFNPGNPGSLGQSRISFRVSAPGTGELRIYSDTNEEIASYSYKEFTGWDQEYVWSGRDSSGKPVADGIYRVEIKGQDINGDNPDSLETYITIDSSLVIRIRSLLSGTSGTLFCPDTDTLPVGSIQLELNGFGHIESNLYRFPFAAAVRFTPVPETEVSVQTGIMLQQDSPEHYIFSASVKNRFFETEGPLKTAGAWYARASYQHNIYTDPLSDYTGGGLGLPVTVSYPPFTLVLTPELVISPFPVTDSGEEPDAGFFFWSYGRAALIFDAGPVMAAVSGVLRTAPFSDGIDILTPVSLGAELSWMLPGTGIFIRGIVSGEFRAADDYYINAGGAFGIIN